VEKTYHYTTIIIIIIISIIITTIIIIIICNINTNISISVASTHLSLGLVGRVIILLSIPGDELLQLIPFLFKSDSQSMLSHSMFLHCVGVRAVVA
jgi:hypothetical protein